MQLHRAPIAGFVTQWSEVGPPTGVPVILLHGGGIDNGLLSWQDVIPEIAAQGYRVLVPDLPGYGGSGPWRRPYGISDYRDWLLAFMDHLELAPAVLIGNSQGGATALSVALAAPERVLGVVPVNSYGLAAVAPVGRLYWSYTRTPLNGAVPWSVAFLPLGARIGSAIFYGAWHVPTDRRSQFRKEARRQSWRLSFQKFLRYEVTREGFRTCFLNELPGLDRPVLFLHGRQDPAIPIRHAREAQAVMPRSQLIELNAGHWPMREVPREVLGAVLPWLKGTLAEARRTVETLRLSLRPIANSDREAVAALLEDPQVRRYLGGVASVEARQAAFEAMLTAPDGGLHWVARTKDGNAFVGLISLTPHKDGEDWELSYQLTPRMWGQGYGAEAVGRIRDLGLVDLGRSRLIAETQAANAPSRRLLESIGLQELRRVERFGAEQVIYVTASTRDPAAPPARTSMR